MSDGAKENARVTRWKGFLCKFIGHTHTEDPPENAPPKKSDIWCCERCYTVYREEQ